MEKWWHVRWRRVALALLIIFVTLGLVGVGAMLVSFQMMPWWFARQTVLENPRLSIAPSSLPDKSIAALSGLSVERFGYSFQVPWKEIERDRELREVSAISFKDGGSLLIPDPLTAVDLSGILREAAKTDQEKELLRRVFGPRALKSNYDLVAAALAATPSQVKWWASRTENIQSFELLSQKELEMHDYLAIYPINSAEMRGFQFGNPAVAPYNVELDLFDRNDRRYKIKIRGKDENHPFITQAEINAMVASIRPIPHS